jgi:hypothetical protein
MAFVIKNTRQTTKSPVLEQWIKVSKATAALPATAAAAIFNVVGGRVILKALLGEVTTIIQAQACNLKVTANPTTGTSVDLASNLDVNADEAGCLYTAELDGTALIGANAGAAMSGVGAPFAIVNVGSIDLETSATNTGSVKWDIFYIPVDPGAYITSA